MLKKLFAAAALSSSIVACAPTEGETVDLHNQRVQLTLIHTSDIHSRLFPYQYTPLQPDIQAGLVAGKGPYGGVARVSYIVNKLRANSDRALHLDGGDVFQGAPIFNYFNGEAEMKSLSQMGTDVMVVANHDFDKGALNLFTQIRNNAAFPTIAANYRADDPAFSGNVPIGAALTPYQVFNVRGLRVAVIGMGNLSTLTSIFQVPNNLGLSPWNTQQIAQFYVDLLRPQVDLIVVLTHLGLEVDQRMIKGTEGIDIVLGGHNHIVVSPPQELYDCSDPHPDTDSTGRVIQPPNTVKISIGDGSSFEYRPCTPRKVLLMHSGAFAKFVGKLDLELTDNADLINQAYGQPTYDPVNGFGVLSHTQEIIPIDSSVPEDRAMTALLEPYHQALNNVGNLDLLVGYAPADLKRKAPAAGDSQLGNLVATSMWLRLGVQTDYAMTNTTGIRADLPKGPVTLEEMFNIFPFDNSITKMELSGEETYELFDFAARRSASRACQSQVQVAGAFIVMNCGACDNTWRADDPYRDTASQACAEQIFIGYTSQSCKKNTDCNPDEKLSRFACDTNIGRCRAPIVRTGNYELATNNYLAGGGSGFKVLQRNTTQLDTKIQQRDAATDFVRFAGHPCGWTYPSCTDDGPCAPLNGTCAFPSGQGVGTCTHGDLIACAVDSDCSDLGDFVCACPESSTAVDTTAPFLSCKSAATCGDSGRCVLRSCRDDVASFHDGETCAGSSGDTLVSCRTGACSQAGEQCKLLACVDATVGALVDGRQQMLGR